MKSQLQRISPGSFIGEHTMLWGFPRRMTVDAVTDCVLGKLTSATCPGSLNSRFGKLSVECVRLVLSCFFLCGSAASLDMSWHLQQHTMIIVLILCTNKVPATIIRYELFLLAVTSYSVTCCSLTYACLQV